MTKNYTSEELIFGFNSTLVDALNRLHPSSTTYFDKSWAEGNAVLYSNKVTPTLSNNTDNAQAFTIEVVSNSSDNTTGKVKSINGVEYPNIQ